MLTNMLMILLCLGTVIAKSKPLQSANIYICYAPDYFVTGINGICKEMYTSDTKTCIECSINRNPVLSCKDSTVNDCSISTVKTLVFKPITATMHIVNRIVELYYNSIQVEMYTLDPLYGNASVFTNGAYHIRIDKIEDDYLIRQFGKSLDVNYCELNIILGFERSEEYRMII